MHGGPLEQRAASGKGRPLSEALEIVRLGIRMPLLDPAIAREFTTFLSWDAYLERIGSKFADPAFAEQLAADVSR